MMIQASHTMAPRQTEPVQQPLVTVLRTQWRDSLDHLDDAGDAYRQRLQDQMRGLADRQRQLEDAHAYVSSMAARLGAQRQQLAGLVGDVVQ